jgi:RNA polymerase sigma-70 factor, ECF subfamily
LNIFRYFEHILEHIEGHRGHFIVVDPVLRIVRAPPGGDTDPSGDDTLVADLPRGAIDDERLVAGLRAREPWATPALVQRYGGHVRRVLFRVFGTPDSEHADVFQDVITAAWQGVAQLHDARALKAWLTQIAVFTARNFLRGRQRRRWLSFLDDQNIPEVETAWAGPEMRDAAHAVYQIFERIPVDERIPFALRMLEGLGLEETAAACGISVATVRRRLTRAERRFFKLARQYESLDPWLEARR